MGNPVQSVLQDQDFQGLSPEGKRSVLRGMDPDFGTLSDSGLDQVMTGLSTPAYGSPAWARAQISGPPPNTNRTLPSSPGPMIPGAEEMGRVPITPDSPMRQMQGVPGAYAQGDIARGTHSAISAGMQTLQPVIGAALPVAAVTAPFPTAAAVGGSEVGKYGAQLASRLFGLTPDQSDVAGDVGALAGGYAGATGAGAISDWAKGDLDAAALRGLQVSSKSSKAQKILSKVEDARPFLQGAQSQADMQARIPIAKAEVIQPMSDALQQRGHIIVNGPDGPESVNSLEQKRLETSAQLQAAQSMNPTDLQTAMQKNQTVANLMLRNRAIKSAIDPELSKTGINPALIRNTYGAIKEIERRVSGKTTLIEPSQPSGFGRMKNISPIENPSSILGEPMRGVRDLLANRPLWSAKPTDLNIREGFSVGGQKPNFRPNQFQPVTTPTGATSPIRGMLPPPGANSATSPFVTPPSVGQSSVRSMPAQAIAGTRASRLGLLLPPPESEPLTTPYPNPEMSGVRSVPGQAVPGTTPLRTGRNQLPAPPLTTPYPNPESSGVVPGALSRELSKYKINATSMTPELARKLNTAITGPQYRDMFPDEQAAYLKSLLKKK